MKERIRNSLFTVLTFSFLFLGVDCKDDPPVVPPDDKPDTTSHDFTWTTYTFGGNAGSSYFKDVAIINDSDIWAVGQIYTSPETTYNAAHWDGKEWILRQIQFHTFCEQTHTYQYPISSVFAFGGNDIWFTNGGEMAHWDGTSFSNDCSINSRINGAINKIWGTGSLNLYIVGNAGTILHYNGTAWTKQVSGTTIDLRDVWGTLDGKTVWACGYSNDNDKSILLKNDGTSWKTVWMRQGVTTNPPFGYFTTSLWADKTLFVSAGRAVFKIISAETTQVATLPWFPYRIRGSAENNIAVVGDEGMVWHYNKSSWKELNLRPGRSFYSVAVAENIIVASGVENAVGFGAALLSLGKRN